MLRCGFGAIWMQMVRSVWADWMCNDYVNQVAMLPHSRPLTIHMQTEIDARSLSYTQRQWNTTIFD